MFKPLASCPAERVFPFCLLPPSLSLHGPGLQTHVRTVEVTEETLQISVERRSPHTAPSLKSCRGKGKENQSILLSPQQP